MIFLAIIIFSARYICAMIREVARAIYLEREFRNKHHLCHASMLLAGIQSSF